MAPPADQVLSWLRSLPTAPEYHPTWAEFQDPISYIFKIEKHASLFGICKIVPPLPPSPSDVHKSLLRTQTGQAQMAHQQPTFTTRQQQIGFCPRNSRRPVQRPVWQSGRRYTFSEFESKAKAFEKTYLGKKGRKHNGLSPLEIETLYWNATVDKPFSVEYANDMPASAFSPLKNASVGDTPWNMRGVSRSRGSLLRFMKEEIPGVTCPMVYVAMLFSWFAWHVEDHDLHSLNYLHFGAGKTWYGVPREAAVAFEEVVRVEGYGGEINPLVTFATLGQKTTVMSPEVFMSAGIPCCRLVQNPGEFVVTFPRAYHTGFSHGFNCGEAANIATPEWLRVANEAAVRRASINYPPMVSHFQLLYDLALALCSRTPVRNNAEPRSSRLKDKKKGEGETVVKSLFVKNVIQNNELLYVLGKGSSIVLLPQSSSDVSVCSKLRVGSQLRVNPDDVNRDGNQGIKKFSVNGKPTSLCQTSRHLSLNRNDSASTPSKMLNMSAKRESNVEGDGLSDQRLFSCVTCGILSFSCVAIVQPKEAAARYLMSADCSAFSDWSVKCEPIQGATADPNSFKKEVFTETRLMKNCAPYVPVQNIDPSNEVNSNAEFQRDNNALGLLALNYGGSSDSEEEQDDQDVPVCGDKTNLSDCSLEGRYEDQSASPSLRASSVGTAGIHSPTSQGFDCSIGLPTIDGNGLPNIDVHVYNRHEATNLKNKGHNYVDHDIDNLLLTNTNGLMSTSIDPVKVSCSASPEAFIQKDSIGTSFAQGFDGDSSWMHVFCLEHAVEVEQQLRSIGGAHILLLCNPDYPRIVNEAKEIAEELGVNYLWNDLEFRNATRADEQRIQSALDSEEAIAGNGDWTVKMGINLFYSASLSRSHLYSKQMPYNSVIYDVFGRSSSDSSLAEPEVSGRTPRQKKVVVGKWCGKVWMSNQVHPLLVKREHEEKNVVQERRIQESPIPVEKLNENTESACKPEKIMVTKQYSRKRKMIVDGEATKKTKCIGAVTAQSVDDESHQEQTRFLKNKRGKHKESAPTKKSNIAKEDVVSSDSMEDDFRRRTLRSEQATHSVGEDDVSDDSMGVDSLQQQTWIAKCKQAKHSAKEFSMVSDDSFGVDSDHQCREVDESNTREFSAVSDDSLEENIYQLHRKSLRRNKSKSFGREKAEDNTVQHKIVRGKQIKLETLHQMTQETPRRVRQGSRRLLESLEQTPRIRNTTDIHDEEPEGGPSTRLRKRNLKEQLKIGKKKAKVEPETGRRNAKEQKQTGRIRVNTASAVMKKNAAARKTKNASVAKIEEAEFMCDIEACTMSFNTKHELNLHKKNTCSVKGCGKQFFSHKYLLQHRRVHEDERPLRCPWKGCKMTFKWAWARTEHIRVHTGARPYICAEPGCGQTFRFVSDFSRHKRKTGHAVKKVKPRSRWVSKCGGRIELSESSSISLSTSAAAIVVNFNVNETDQAVDLAAAAIGSQHSTAAESRKDDLRCFSGDAYVSPTPAAAADTAVSSGIERGGVGEVDHAVIGEIAKLELKDDDADVAVTVEPLAVEEERVVEAVEVEEEEEEKCEGVEIGEKSEDDVEVVEKKKGGENERWRQYPLRPEAEECVIYLKKGACKFGSNCKFNHPVRRKTYNQGLRERVKEKDEFSDYPSQTECKYYLGPGGCKYGKGCRYIHGKGKGPVAPVEELNFLGLPIRQGERKCPYYMRTCSCKFGTNCKYNHPDPTAAGGSDPPSGFVGNNGPTPLQGGSQSLSWTAPRSLNETPPYMPMMIPPSQGVPSRNSEWNGYQPPFYPDRGMPAPPPYVINDSVIETNVYKQYPQSNQVDELPEQPGQPLCNFYLRTGDCKFKFNCKYHHPKSQTVVSPSFTLSDKGLPLRPDQNICTHYSRYGICKFGPACKYDHPIHLTSSTTSGLDHQLPFSDLANTREVGIAENTSRTDNIIHL